MGATRLRPTGTSLRIKSTIGRSRPRLDSPESRLARAGTRSHTSQGVDDACFDQSTPEHRSDGFLRARVGNRWGDALLFPYEARPQSQDGIAPAPLVADERRESTEPVIDADAHWR